MPYAARARRKPGDDSSAALRVVGIDQQCQRLWAHPRKALEGDRLVVMRLASSSCVN
jgi:hypothetical protein